MNCFPALFAIGLLFFLASSGNGNATESEESAPAFDLPQHDGNQRVQLAGLKGRIVVLDFFAHWCVPCVRASTELETGIREYYDLRHGNARGIPVELWAVNLEASRPDKTEAFITRAGLKKVLDDLSGTVFQKYGGSGMPYLVIIDNTGGPSGNAPARVVYRKAGFAGIAELRQMIESIGAVPKVPAAVADAGLEPGAPANILRPAANAQPASSTNITPPQEIQSSRPTADTTTDRIPPSYTQVPAPPTPIGDNVTRDVSVDFATLLASDITLTDELMEYRETRPVSEFTLSLSHGHTGLHYQPDSLIEQAKNVDNDRFTLQTCYHLHLNDTLTGSLGGGGYSGYMDYRSLWLNEHFRQLYSMRPGYEAADPWGANAAGGLRWEYLPAAGFVQGDLTYQHDVISPGYDVSLATFPLKLDRFRSNYETVSGKLSLENVLTRRMRALQELQVTGTTDRQLRYTLQSSLNFAVAEHWVAKLAVTGTEETPRFQAAAVSLTMERDWKETWFVSLMGRGYRDNGEVENALLAENTASPPLESYQTGLGLRWQGRQNSLKLFAGPCFSRYQQSGPSFDTFPNLYQNRNWVAVQFAFAREF
jgi:peroxiredoxin